jgi:hypothetical protein
VIRRLQCRPPSNVPSSVSPLPPRGAGVVADRYWRSGQCGPGVATISSLKQRGTVGTPVESEHPTLAGRHEAHRRRLETSESAPTAPDPAGDDAADVGPADTEAAREPLPAGTLPQPAASTTATPSAAATSSADIRAGPRRRLLTAAIPLRRQQMRPGWSRTLSRSRRST